MAYKSKFDSIITKKALKKAYYKLGSYPKTAAHFKCTVGVIRRLIKKYKILSINHKHYFNEEFFSKDNEESFYWAGFIAADGCVYLAGSSKEVNVLHIKLASRDINHLKKFKKHIKAEYKIYIHPHVSEKGKALEYCEIRLCSVSMIKDLLRFNIVPAKTKIYTFPKWLINHPLVHHFMRGYFDGDGWVSITCLQRKTSQLGLGLISANINFIQTYKKIIDKITNTNVSIITNNDGIHNNTYKIGWVGNSLAPKVARFLYKDANVVLDRKFKKIIKHMKRYNYGNLD